MLQIASHGPHRVGDLAKLRELRVECPQGEEILADRGDLRRSNEHCTNNWARARSQKDETEGQGSEDIIEWSVGFLRRVQHADNRSHTVGRS